MFLTAGWEYGSLPMKKPLHLTASAIALFALFLPLGVLASTYYYSDYGSASYSSFPFSIYQGTSSPSPYSSFQNIPYNSPYSSYHGISHTSFDSWYGNVPSVPPYNPYEYYSANPYGSVPYADCGWNMFYGRDRHCHYYNLPLYTSNVVEPVRTVSPISPPFHARCSAGFTDVYGTCVFMGSCPQGFRYDTERSTCRPSYRNPGGTPYVYR
jgi:hypothetical protein